MKKLRFLMITGGLLLSLISQGQNALTFKLANPKITYYTSPTPGQYFEFDILVKAQAAHYLYSGDVSLSYNSSSLTSVSGLWIFSFGPDFSGLNSIFTAKYKQTAIAVGSGIADFSFGGEANLVGSTLIPTDWTTISTVDFQTFLHVKVFRNGDANGMAGIDFNVINMNGYVSYLAAVSSILQYTAPNIYDAAKFTDTYLGRIYANGAWTQTGGSTNGVAYTDWTTAVNTSVWDGAATIPTGTSNVASAVRIHSGATLTIPSTGALTATNLENNTAGGLTIQSSSNSATGSLLTDAVTGLLGTTVVQRYMDGDIWHLISPPVTGNDFSTFTVGNSIGHNSSHYALASYGYVTADEWSYYAYPAVSGTSFSTHGEGYQILRTTGTPTGNGTAGGSGVVNFTGALAATPAAIGITETHSTYGWNLIGNPYPCGLDITTFLNTNSAQMNSSNVAIYVSDLANTGGYFGYTAINLSNVGTFKLASGEGFFVKSISGGGTVNFTTAMKSASAGPFKSAALNFPTINLSAETASDKMSTTVNYISGMGNGLDPGYDAGLFNGGGLGSFSLSTRLIQDNGVDFQIQCLPDNDYENMVVPVGLVASSGSAITFKAAVTNLPSGLKVVLEDRVANTFTRLDGGGTYSVTLNAASAGPGRFFLRTTTIVSAVPGDLSVELKVVPLPNQQIIQVYGNVNLPARALVYDMNGKLLTTKVLTGIDLFEIPLVNVANGVYLLKIESNKTPLTQKIRWIRD